MEGLENCITRLLMTTANFSLIDGRLICYFSVSHRRLHYYTVYGLIALAHQHTTLHSHTFLLVIRVRCHSFLHANAALSSPLKPFFFFHLLLAASPLFRLSLSFQHQRRRELFHSDCIYNAEKVGATQWEKLWLGGADGVGKINASISQSRPFWMLSGDPLFSSYRNSLLHCCCI